MTVAAAVVVVASAWREGKHGSYVDADEESHRRETIAAVAAAAAACHHHDTSVAAAAASAACHRREASVAAAAAAAACHHRLASVAAAAAAAEACHHRETSVAAAAAAVEAYHRREIPYRRPFVDLRPPRPPRPKNHGRRQEHGGSMVLPAHPLPAIVSQFHGPCVESRRNGWCFIVSGGSVGAKVIGREMRAKKKMGSSSPMNLTLSSSTTSKCRSAG